MKTRLLGAVGLLVVAIAPCMSGYKIVDLGTLGGSSSIAYDINDSGQVTGGSGHAFLYDGSAMQDLGTLGGMHSSGYSINNSGQVTGGSDTIGGDWHAFLYDGSAMQDLGTLGGAWTVGYCINDSAQVVGESELTIGSTTRHAFLYDGSTMQDLGTLGGDRSWAGWINTHGQIVGSSNDASGNWRAFLYDGSTMQDLGTLGGAQSFAYRINDSGQIVGESQIAIGSTISHPFLYDGSTMRDLGTLRDDDFESYAADVNTHGQVVGACRNPSNHRAFLYDGSNMLDLCSVTDCVSAGWDYLAEASAINDNGDITGYGSINGQTHAFLVLDMAAPVPVVIDIKPDSDTNPINLQSQGVIPVAILTTEGFDAVTVDPVSVEFAGASPLRWAMEDVDYDGDVDLILHFDTQGLNIDCSTTQAKLTGETFEGVELAGTDSIKTVGCNQPQPGNP